MHPVMHIYLHYRRVSSSQHGIHPRRCSPFQNAVWRYHNHHQHSWFHIRLHHCNGRYRPCNYRFDCCCIVDTSHHNAASWHLHCIAGNGYGTIGEVIHIIDGVLIINRRPCSVAIKGQSTRFIMGVSFP